MTRKELKKLSRAELLELLLEQTKEVENLREELKETKQLLEDKRICIEEAGNLAEAVVQVNALFKTAQETADQYLQNIMTMEFETKQKCNRLLQEAEVEKAKLLSQASMEREVKISEMKRLRNKKKK